MSHQMISVYTGELKTSGTHLKSGNTIITSAPPDNNGKGDAYSPTDLTCASLASCMMTIMGILADRNAWDISGMKAEITKTMASDPRRISEIKIKIQLEDSKIALLDEKSLTMLKNAAIHCPVAHSLHPDIKQDIQFNF